ncbi:hypothetical protein UPYG_G00354040 [Umbra pygmaea]|uniref:Ig-like domain-containing protein n=1 Tax=Umbra pygmaea TaxID=75934 RepID=A0ABD0VX05_UMBPY
MLLIVTFLMVTAWEQINATLCNLTQPSGNNPCYGALEGSVSFILNANQAEGTITLKKGDTLIMKTGEGWTFKILPDYVNRSKFLKNTTFTLNSVMKSDSGDYQLEKYSSGGKLMETNTMQLQIQAPVSEQVLSYVCLSHGETKVTCSSGGDGLQFNWNLNGQTTTNSVFSDNYHNSVIILKAVVNVTLTCTVQNEVSYTNTTIFLTACTVSSSHLRFIIMTVIVALSVGTLILLVTVIIGINRKSGEQKLGNTPSGQYGILFFTKHGDVNQRPPANEMVEYGEIKIAASEDVNSESHVNMVNTNVTVSTFCSHK